MASSGALSKYWFSYKPEPTPIATSKCPWFSYEPEPNPIPTSKAVLVHYNCRYQLHTTMEHPERRRTHIEKIDIHVQSCTTKGAHDAYFLCPPKGAQTHCSLKKMSYFHDFLSGHRRLQCHKSTHHTCIGRTASAVAISELAMPKRPENQRRETSCHMPYAILITSGLIIPTQYWCLARIVQSSRLALKQCPCYAILMRPHMPRAVLNPHAACTMQPSCPNARDGSCSRRCPLWENCTLICREVSCMMPSDRQLAFHSSWYAAHAC